MKANFRFELILHKFVYFLRMYFISSATRFLLKAPRSSTFFFRENGKQ